MIDQPCARCREPIDVERLAIVPDTEYCVACMGRIERRDERRIRDLVAARAEQLACV